MKPSIELFLGYLQIFSSLKKDEFTPVSDIVTKVTFLEKGGIYKMLNRFTDSGHFAKREYLKEGINIEPGGKMTDYKLTKKGMDIFKTICKIINKEL